jgi:hypothetical protein
MEAWEVPTDEQKYALGSRPARFAKSNVLPADAKEVGMGNPSEETCRRQDGGFVAQVKLSTSVFSHVPSPGKNALESARACAVTSRR